MWPMSYPVASFTGQLEWKWEQAHQILFCRGGLLEMYKKENEDGVLFKYGLGRAYEGAPECIFILFLVGIK